MKKSYNITNKYENKIVKIIILSVIFLTIGYAAFSSELGIRGLSANVRVERDIRITGISVSSTTSGAISNWENYNVSSISSGIQLPNNDSTVTYHVTVMNIGNIEACISAISDLPNNLTYSINNYNLNDVLCDDNDSTQCTLGSITTIEITIGYATGGYDSSNIDHTINMDFTFTYMVDAVAKIADQYYETLQEAINTVPTNNTPTTIILLKDTSEIITIANNKTINFDFKNNTLSNDGNFPVISNNGTVSISNGTVTSNAATNGAINNESTGTITISGGRVIVTGGRQALYNNKGTATITGSAYLYSQATERAAVQNVSGGTMTITGGTIISTGSYALNNAGTMTIGIKDGTVHNDSPLFKGTNNGITSSTNFNFYDGIVKSKTDPFNNIAKITDSETGYGIIDSTEVIDNQTYKIAYLGITYKVSFNANGGNVSETVRYVETGHEIGTLPTPIRSGYDFDGWFTQKTGGVQVNANTTFNNDITLYAHWTKTNNVARIGTTMYATVQEAINAVPTNNTPTTITVLKDASEQLIVASGKNIIFDLDGITLTNSGNKPIFENHGSIHISNGALHSSAEQSIINQVEGSLLISGGELIITSTKQAVYITGGTVEISGNAYLSSKTSGKPSGSNMERGTIHNVSGTLTITGGTIIGINQQAVSNESTTTIGQKDGTINTSTPILRGKVYGIKSTGTLNFYDGIFQGKTNAIIGTVTDKETNSQIVTGTEVISGETYNTAYLQ